MTTDEEASDSIFRRLRGEEGGRENGRKLLARNENETVECPLSLPKPPTDFDSKDKPDMGTFPRTFDLKNTWPFERTLPSNYDRVLTT